MLLNSELVDLSPLLPPRAGTASMIPVQVGKSSGLLIVADQGDFLIDLVAGRWQQLDAPRTGHRHCLASLNHPGRSRLCAMAGSDDGIYGLDADSLKWEPIVETGEPVYSLYQIPEKHSLRIAWGSRDGAMFWSSLNGRSTIEGNRTLCTPRVPGPITLISPLGPGSGAPLILGGRGVLAILDYDSSRVRPILRAAAGKADGDFRCARVLRNDLLIGGSFDQVTFEGQDSSIAAGNIISCNLETGAHATLGGSRGVVVGIGAAGRSSTIVCGGTSVPTKDSGIAFFNGRHLASLVEEDNIGPALAMCQCGTTVFVAQYVHDPAGSFTALWKLF